MKFNILIGAAMLTAITAAGALAHGGATGIVKQRMDAMVAMGKVVKSLSEMMRGDTDYDAEAVRQGAEIVKTHAGQAMTALFPEGSGGNPSEARAEIWQDWETFDEMAKQLGILAEGLSLAAANGPMMRDGMKSGSKMGMSDMMGTGGKNAKRGEGMSNGGMMAGGSSMMMGNGSDMMVDPAQLAKMPADGVFNMMTRTCSACHTKFRLEKK